jgi:hypothetical protein
VSAYASDCLGRRTSIRIGAILYLIACQFTPSVNEYQR